MLVRAIALNNFEEAIAPFQNTLTASQDKLKGVI